MLADYKKQHKTFVNKWKDCLSEITGQEILPEGTDFSGGHGSISKLSKKCSGVS
jgi:hypothetical protein